MTSPIALELDGVSVRYRVPLDRYMTLKEMIVHGRRPRNIEHLALDGITLAVAPGEMLGVIGRNGAGKTTLLNVMARVLHPSHGRLRVRGTVASLIEFAGGFHPELTGRENAMLRGAFLGVGRAAMRARIGSIEAFADIGPFFDAPLRTYSAGMIVRLAFAVATSADADILLVDEALGVGDAEFQTKCAARMDDFRRRGVTFVVVSHDTQRVAASCDRLVWLEAGRIAAEGCPREVVAQYMASLQRKESGSCTD
jgi:ABC-type polysaccharide/polyol phosphate transport system ATPase subunit